MNYKKLKRVKNKKRSYIFDKYPNAVGVGVAEKTKNGKKTGKWALTIYVEKKLPTASLAAAHRIDLDGKLIAAVGATEHLDVVEIGKIRKLAGMQTDRVRPVIAGMSEGHYGITAGTGGVLVQDDAGHIRRLSNNHVYARENNAQEGDAIYQPGPYDGGRVMDMVGVLVTFIPLNDIKNIVDVATRSTNLGELTDIKNIDRVSKRTAFAEPGQTVIKSGRTTGITRGEIIDVAADIRVEYDLGDILFVDQIIVQTDGRFSQGGDSGSSVFLDTELLDWVGILFAGSDDGTFTVCNHAVDAEMYLGVKLYVPDEIQPEPEPEPEPIVELTFWKSLLNWFKTLFNSIIDFLGF